MTPECVIVYSLTLLMFLVHFLWLLPTTKWQVFLTPLVYRLRVYMFDGMYVYIHIHVYMYIHIHVFKCAVNTGTRCHLCCVDLPAGEGTRERFSRPRHTTAVHVMGG